MQKSILASLAALTLLTAGQVAAQQPTTGFYAGATAGYGLSPNNANTGTQAKLDTKNRAASFRGFVGYRVEDGLAVEVQAGSLGKVQQKSSDAEINSLTARSTMLGGVSMLAIAPLGKSFDAFARIGMATVRLKGQDGNRATSHTSIVPWLGAGAQYNITKNVFARAEYQFTGKARLDKYKQSSHTVGLSLGYRF